MKFCKKEYNCISHEILLFNLVLSISVNENGEINDRNVRDCYKIKIILLNLLKTIERICLSDEFGLQLNVLYML